MSPWASRACVGWETSMTQHRDALVPSTVRIGGLTKQELLHALRRHDVQLNRAGEALFADDRFTTRKHEENIRVVSVSVSELGFGDGATYDCLVARALELRLVECPLETGPHLRLQWLNQPEAGPGVVATSGQEPPGSLTIASPRVDERDDTPKGFYLRRADGVLWLRGFWAQPGHIWGPGARLAFSREHGGEFDVGSESSHTTTPLRS